MRCRLLLKWSLFCVFMCVGCSDEATTSSGQPRGTGVDADSVTDISSDLDADTLAVDAANTGAAEDDLGEGTPQDTGSRDEDAGLAVESDLGSREDVASEDVGQDTEDAPSNLSAGLSLDACDTVSLLAPSLPSEAGHYAAKVVTPASYPFSIESIQYSLLTNSQVLTCSGALEHRVLLFAIEADQGLPATPSANGLGYREYDVPADPSASGGRNIDISVPIPLILTEGQRAVVAVQFAVQGDEHICLAECPGPDAIAGTEWWSNTAEPPFQWQDLVSDFNLDTRIAIEITGSLVE